MKSGSVRILTAALVERKCAHGNNDKHKSMVVDSDAQTVLSRSAGRLSPVYSRRARAISRCANSA
jgi:hypothetical protein